MNRKERLIRNLGGSAETSAEQFFNGPLLAEARTAIVLPERIILSLLRTEITRLAADRAETLRFFSHFFDTTVDEDERNAFVDNFVGQPPAVVLGYPRTTTEMPCFSVILESEAEVSSGGQYLGDYMGETLEGEEAEEVSEYVGGLFESSYSVYVYAQHPDACIYLYHFAKMILFGAKSAMVANGLIEPMFSGGELSPQDMYLPDNLYARVLSVKVKNPVTIPRVRSYTDGRNLRVGGAFREDVVVDGMRGRAKTFEVGK